MHLYELKEQLQKRKVNPVYYFTGEETGIMDIYINQIASILGVETKRIDALTEVYSTLQSTSMLTKPNLYVIRDDKGYAKAEDVWDRVNDGMVQGDNVLVFVYTKLDKRSKFFKNTEHLFVTFERLIPDILAKYIKKEIGLGVSDGIDLAKRCNCDYTRVMTECKKISDLALGKDISIEDAYDLAIESNLIYTLPEDKIFELVDSVCKRDVVTSYRLYEQLKQIEPNPLGFISLLYMNMKNTLTVAMAGTGADLVQRTGLSSWQISLVKERGIYYNIDELVGIVRAIRETEKGIKTGLIESDKAVHYIFGKIF